MIIVLKPNSDQLKVDTLKNQLAATPNLVLQEIVGENTAMIGLAGDTSAIDRDNLQSYDVVDRIIKVSEPYKLASRRFHPTPSVIDISGVKIGDGNFAVIAGPCSVESESQVLSVARDVKAAGASMLRGGAFKPRTSPYAFTGLGLEGLELLKIARQKTGMPIVSEIMSSDYLDAFAADVDLIQIGARNMQNFTLLKQVGALKKPVLIKRGLSATIDETLMACEHIMAGGATDIVICERGIRTFETATRNTLDLAAVPVLRTKTHLPVVVDPSHATGYWHLVEPLSLAAVAAGADGLIIEVHNNPEKALCDGAQSLTPQIFNNLMRKVNMLRATMERF